MKVCRYLIGILAATLCFMGFAATFSGTMVGGTTSTRAIPRVLAIGASNTGGQGTTGNVRQFAWRKEFQDITGIGNYNMVGDYQTPPSSDEIADGYDLDNSGVGGETSAQIEARLLNDLQQYMSVHIAGDAVVIEAGKNDSNLNSAGDREGARDNIEDMIDIVQTFNPDIAVYVLLIEPVNEGAGTMLNADIVTYNALVSVMLETYQGSKSNLYYIDIYDAFISDTTSLCSSDWLNNCWQDHKHPNALGYQVMGRVIGNSFLDCSTESECN